VLISSDNFAAFMDRAAHPVVGDDAARIANDYPRLAMAQSAQEVMGYAGPVI